MLFRSIAVCHSDDEAARQWFRSIRTASEAGDPTSDSWATIRERVIEQSAADGVPGTSVAAFLDYLDAFAADPTRIIRGVAAMMAHEEVLMTAYRELSADAVAKEGQTWSG